MKNFLQKNYPLAKIIPVDSTAKAAEIVAGGAENYAAIATNVAAKLYNLEIKASDIEDMNTNCTRFVVLHKDKQEVLGAKVATAIVATRIVFLFIILNIIDKSIVLKY